MFVCRVILALAKSGPVQDRSVLVFLPLGLLFRESFVLSPFSSLAHTVERRYNEFQGAEAILYRKEIYLKPWDKIKW